MRARWSELDLSKERFVRVRRRVGGFEDRFSGVLVASTPDWRLYATISDYIVPDGVQLVRTRDIADEFESPRSAFYSRVLKAKGAHLAYVPKIASFSLQDFCIWMMRAGVHGVFHYEEARPGEVRVGLIRLVSAASIAVLCVDPFGVYDEEQTIFICPELTRIDCLGEYERSFDLLQEKQTA